MYVLPVFENYYLFESHSRIFKNLQELEPLGTLVLIVIKISKLVDCLQQYTTVYQYRMLMKQSFDDFLYIAVDVCCHLTYY